MSFVACLLLPVRGTNGVPLQAVSLFQETPQGENGADIVSGVSRVQTERFRERSIGANAFAVLEGDAECIARRDIPGLGEEKRAKIRSRTKTPARRRGNKVVMKDS